MSLDDILLDAEERMEKTVAKLKEQLVGIRTGRANTALVDNIMVEYYGSPTPLKQLASIAVPEASMMLIKPFDSGTIGEIERAILKANIGVTPSNEGKQLRLVLPPLSEERRRKLVAQVQDMGEGARVAIRNVRRDANRSMDREQGLSEDDVFAAKEEVQNLTNQYETQVNKIIEDKSDDLMTV